MIFGAQNTTVEDMQKQMKNQPRAASLYASLMNVTVVKKEELRKTTQGSDCWFEDENPALAMKLAAIRTAVLESDSEDETADDAFEVESKKPFSLKDAIKARRSALEDSDNESEAENMAKPQAPKKK